MNADARRRRQLASAMALVIVLGLAAGLATGSAGFSPSALRADLLDGNAALLLGQIRAPRSLGAALVGALLGLAGAIAQGLFRNPLADPYLLGSASGAALGVVLVLAAAALAGHGLGLTSALWIERVGLVSAAFAGALAGVGLTLLLARGAVQTLRLLLAGVVVGVVLGAISDLITVAAPDTLRGKQMFMLGSTSFMGWDALALLGAGLVPLLWLAWRHARALDALTLGEDSAASLGLDLGAVRLRLVLMLSLGTLGGPNWTWRFTWDRVGPEPGRVLALITATTFGASYVGTGVARASRLVNADLQSHLEADYSPATAQLKFAPLKPEIITAAREDAAVDQQTAPTQTPTPQSNRNQGQPTAGATAKPSARPASPTASPAPAARI